MTTIENAARRRVRVRRDPLAEQLGVEPWRAVLFTEPDDGDGEIVVGRYLSQPEAVLRGVTALRFVSAGIPWRER